jgi:hypothetical protein
MTVNGSSKIQVHKNVGVLNLTCPFTARETAPGIYMREGYSPGAILNALENGKISCPSSNKPSFKGFTACDLIIIMNELILAPFMYGDNLNNIIPELLGSDSSD